MEYALIFALQIIGIGLNVMQNLMLLGTKFPDEEPLMIIHIFWKQDWDSLGVSAFVLMLDLTVHFAFSYFKAPFITGEYYIFISLGIALVLGYAGQRMVYKYLGSAEKFLDKKVGDQLDK